MHEGDFETNVAERPGAIVLLSTQRGLSGAPVPSGLRVGWNVDGQVAPGDAGAYSVARQRARRAWNAARSGGVISLWTSRA
jgi:hypothetical protein